MTNTPNTSKSYEEQVRDFNANLESLHGDNNTLCETVCLLEDYIYDNLKNSKEVIRVSAFLDMLKVFMKNIDNKYEKLFPLYYEIHPSRNTIIAMEYANEAKSVIRIFLSNNHIILQSKEYVQSRDLRVHDTFFECQESLSVQLEKRPLHSVAFC